ncbi:MAG: hypothetical protein JXR07_15110 [Reichenbachiella sp.]
MQKVKAYNIRYEMQGDLAENGEIEVFVSPADSVLHLMRNKKYVSRISDSDILVTETKKI